MRYELYKDSEIPWIGEIPSSWKLIPNKVLFKKRQIKVGEAYKNYQLLSLTTGGIKEKSIEDSRGKVPASYSGYQQVRPHDMVFCLFDLDVSAVFSGISKYNGMITSAYDVAECNELYIDEDYVDYWFQYVFSNRYYKMYSKNVRYTISFDAFGSLKTPVPSIEEQKKIAHYLDWQVSKINSLIDTRNQQVRLLREQREIRISRIVKRGLDETRPLKDSGIDYIGKVPDHWQILLNGRLFKENSRKFEGDELVLSLSQKDGLLPYENMKERSLHTASYDNWKLVLPNDLVLNRFKAHLGVFFASKYRGIVTFHYGVFVPKRDANSKYYEALYHTPEYRTVYAGRSNGMTVGLQNLSNQNFYDVYTIYPPKEEQDAIVKEIEKVEQQTKEAIDAINDYIDILHELRSRIIAEAVTGHIDVREIEVPDFEHIDEDIEIENDEEVDESEEQED